MSSDPAMNWRISELEDKRIVSFGDAHSPPKLGREATVFEVPKLSFESIRRAVWGEEGASIDYTIEFYPEEGKYHYTGHRNCKVVYSPNEARKMGTVCPVCGRPLTVGVMSRVEHLASRDVEVKAETDDLGVRWIKASGPDLRPGGTKRPYIMLVPLLEILAEALGSSVGSQTVLSTYDQLVTSLGSEFGVLLSTPISEIERVGGSKVAEGVSKVRSGDIVIDPGYDGVFGKVRIWREEEKEAIDQGALF